ncbi:AsmA-like C-terminal region-containing protein [Hymenobacter sp. M29]|uniref:AsmA-like C-terminal region-containing protein n=1 Tax=Hymenobacter mellowenesis TaxID=3063995 RepID=A0ABT9AH17_9BACT|nr:AsmA-like C-terminal region-containing protein [Hymenobacter sp. M29]MDO7848853.1 AsmA-like C-terminal region-containing protein [Hymenobacter sp. M29]
MRKILLGIGVFLVVLVLAAVAAPFLFKDKLRALADKQIAQRVRAQVQYDPANIGLSVFHSFPDLTLDIKDLRVIGLDSFSRDTLAYLPNLRVGLDVMTVIKGEEIKINSVELERPDLSLRRLKSGRANWDVVISDSAAAAKGQDTSQVSLAIKGWKLTDAHLRYEDLTLPFRMEARGVNHSGSGDFASNVFDMKSQTTAADLDMTYGGVAYVTDKQLDADVTLNMDLNKNLYTFKDNKIKLNDFPFSFAGAIGLPNATDITYDITFKALETDFKTLLSLVPGVFTEKFKNIETSGKVAFDGYAKGTQTTTQLPGYGVNLVVSNGRFKYPDLPREAKNINLKMKVDNPTGVTNDVKVDIPQFHLDLGPDPVDGSVAIDGLNPMKVDGRVKANVNLAEALKVYPVKDLNMRGQFFVDGVAKGIYSKTQMPVVNAAIRLTNGYVKSAKFPAPIENINLNGTVVNTTGQVNDTQINLPQFKMLLEGEPLEGRLTAHNIDKPVFDTNVRGTVDLTKITKIFPLQGMTVTGRVAGDIAAKGNMADVEAGRYQNVVASGTVKANNVTYKSKDLPQGVKISSGTATFNNNQIALQSLNGTAGSSDFAASGTISNYLGYLFTPGQSLKGNMTVNSQNFNVNEWMVDEVSAKPTATGAKAPAAANGVLQIPKYFDLVLNSHVDNVTYDNLKLTNAQGVVTVNDQTATLKNLKFNTLGASFGTTGSYSSKDLAHPKFNFGLNIDNLNFQKAFSAFNTIKTLVPLASQVEGVFGTNFSVSGEMGPDMMPNLATLSGKGLFDIVRAAVNQSEVMTKIASLTTLPELKTLLVVDKKIQANIVNGNLVVQPFDLTIGDVKMNIGGSNSLTGVLSYITALNVPTGKLGTAMSSKLTQLTGVQNIQGTDRVTLGLNIGGTVKAPVVKLTSGSMKDQGKTLVQNVAKQKALDLLGVKPRAISKEDSIRRAGQTAEEAAAQAELDKKQQRIDAANKAKEQISKGFNSLFNKPKPKPKPVEPADSTK